MTALALSIDVPTAAVILTISGAPAGACTITRTDANGTNPVRLRTGQVPIAGSMIVQDYEAALVGSISYSVVDGAAATTSGSTALNLTGSAPRVGQVQLPSLTVVPEWITGYSGGRGSSSAVHWPVDRGDPIVITRPPRTRTGMLTCRSSSYALGLAVHNVISPGAQLMLRQADHTGLDMYFVVTSSDLEPVELLAGGWAWQLRCEFVEVKAPALPLLGAAGWDFADVTAGYASFAAVRAAFPTFAALTVGP